MKLVVERLRESEREREGARTDGGGREGKAVEGSVMMKGGGGD